MPIQTEIVLADDPKSIQRALEVLQKGGLVAFPTDTVYGLGALAFDGNAVEAIFLAKDRPIEKAIPVLIGDEADLEKVSNNISQIVYKLVSQFWPGPLTVVVPKKPTLPEAVSEAETVGVRVPDHQVARTLLHSTGPLAVTSANISGQPSPSTAQEVFEQLNGRIELIIDGGKTPGGVPSTLVDCTASEIRVLRQGPISLEQILSAISQ